MQECRFASMLEEIINKQCTGVLTVDDRTIGNDGLLVIKNLSGDEFYVRITRTECGDE